MVLAMVGLVVLGVVRAQPGLDSLLVYGEGFAFSVKEPEGWIGDTEHAGMYQANALYPRGQRVQVFLAGGCQPDVKSA